MKTNKIECPGCHKKDIIKSGFRYTTEGKKQRYRCKECGHTFCLPTKQGDKKN